MFNEIRYWLKINLLVVIVSPFSKVTRDTFVKKREGERMRVERYARTPTQTTCMQKNIAWHNIVLGM